MLSSDGVHFCTQFETSESDNDEIVLEIIVSIFHRLGVVICSWGWVERWKGSRHVFNPHTWCHMNVMVSQNTATSLLVQPLVHINNTKNIKATHDWTFVRADGSPTTNHYHHHHNGLVMRKAFSRHGLPMTKVCVESRPAWHATKAICCIIVFRHGGAHVNYRVIYRAVEKHTC